MTMIAIMLAITAIWMKIRVQYIHEKRVGMIFSQWEEYQKMPTYYEMVFKFWWIWDISKFPRNNNTGKRSHATQA